MPGERPGLGHLEPRNGSGRGPGGLELDGKTGIISGNVPSEEGEYPVILTASNVRGSQSRPFKIVVGDTLAQMMFGTTVGGIVGSAAESAGKACGGPFRLVPMEEAAALAAIERLGWSR